MVTEKQFTTHLKSYYNYKHKNGMQCCVDLEKYIFEIGDVIQKTTTEPNDNTNQNKINNLNGVRQTMQQLKNDWQNLNSFNNKKVLNEKNDQWVQVCHDVEQLFKYCNNDYVKKDIIPIIQKIYNEIK